MNGKLTGCSARRTGWAIASVAALTGKTCAEVKRAAAGIAIVVSDPILWFDPEPMARLLAHFDIPSRKP